jgi:pimeloyl-ACP methyl ester carboxylesterase
VDLFVRESGFVGAPAIVFLHGGEYTGHSWQPVIERMQQYHCLVPDLPQHGKSLSMGPFTIGDAAAAVAEVIRTKVSSGRAHLVGLSLGSQVAAQLLATEPKLVDRAVLCGTTINAIPGARLTGFLMGRIARVSRLVTIRTNTYRRANESSAAGAGSREDLHPMNSADIAQIVEESTRFTLPAGLENSDSPTLFLTGAQELAFVRRSAAALARRMPNGTDRVVLGVHHEWPLRNPDLFARTVGGWLSGTALPPEIAEPVHSRKAGE